MTTNLTPSEVAEVASKAAKRRVEPKWTRRNDEWIQVLCEIHQGPGGRYDRPSNANAQTGAK